VSLRLAALLCAVAAPLAFPSGARSGGVQVTGHVQFEGDTPVLRLAVQAAGHEPADDVTPTIVYAHREWRGEPAAIAAGGRHPWSFDLPPPDGPGTFPVSIRVDHRSGGRAAMAPLVLVLATPGAAESPVRAALDTTPIASFGRGELALENRDDRPVAGRVSFLLPSGLRTDPASAPQRLAASERAVVPLLIENRGAASAAAASLFAVFEYDADGAHHTVVTTAPLEITAPGRLSVPIVIGLATLALAVGMLALAWRRAAAR
jgi:hypothetical protein